MTLPNQRGRVPVDPDIFRQPGTLAFGASGQSMLGNYGEFPVYVPDPGTVYEWGEDGNIYESDGYAVLGDEGWSAPGAPGNRLSVLPYWGSQIVAQGKAARVLFGHRNVGGTTAAQWAGVYAARSHAFIASMAAKGIPINLWVHMLGQGDMIACTPSQSFVDSTVAYYNGLRTAGYKGLIVTGQGSAHYGYHPFGAHATAYAGIESFAKHRATFTAVGPCTLGPNDDEWSNSERVDAVHPGAAMRLDQAARWMSAFPNKTGIFAPAPNLDAIALEAAATSLRAVADTLDALRS